jgi:ABC-type phosphate transport system auxiliary subunit
MNPPFMNPPSEQLSIFETLSLQEMRKINDNLEQLRNDMVKLQVATAEHSLMLNAAKSEMAKIENICNTCQARENYSTMKAAWQTLAVVGSVLMAVGSFAWNIYKG